MHHRAFVSHEQPQQLDESRAVEATGRPVRRGLDRDRVGDTRDRQPLLASQLGAEDRARGAPGRDVPEQPWDAVRGEARYARHPFHGATRRAASRVGEHEIRIRAAADESQQRLDMRRGDARVLPDELLELRELHLDGGRETQTLHEQLVGKLAEPIFDGGIEILDRLEDGERYDAVDHGARNVAWPTPLRNSGRRTSLHPTIMAPPSIDEKRESFEKEALVHLDVMYRVALRLTANPADADDLVQETMLKAYRAWDQYEKGTNAKAWLLTILRHAFINEYRRRTRHPETVDVDTIEPYAVFSEVQDEDPQGAFFDRIVDDEVLRAIDQLPEAFRETLVLSDVEGMSYQEIAGILEVPIGTVKSRLFRARQLLQGKLYDYAVEMGYIKGSPA